MSYSEETRTALAQRWPHLFSVPVPLKIGIHRDYPKPGDRPIGIGKFRRFLMGWTGTRQYKMVLARSKCRYDFAGNMCPLKPEGK